MIGSDGSIYVVGNIKNGSYDFGNSITATGINSNNIIIVKYNSSGTAQWAKTITSGTSASSYNGICYQSDMSIYAVGEIWGSDVYNFGNGVTATGTSAGRNIILVKYDYTGWVYWAKTVSSGTGNSVFNSVNVASDGSIYASGYIGAGSYNFGNSITASGTASTNPIVVKYNSSGTTQWAKTITLGTNSCIFNSIISAANSSLYVVGNFVGTDMIDFGNSITATGSNSGYNIIIVKYNSSGTPQWARTMISGTGSSEYYGIASASNGYIYAAGYITATGTYDFGNSVTANAPYSGNEAVLVKYQW